MTLSAPSGEHLIYLTSLHKTSYTKATPTAWNLLVGMVTCRSDSTLKATDHLSFNSSLSQYPGSGAASLQNQSFNKMQLPRHRIARLRTEVSEERRHGSLGRKNHRY
jgi:hypothetical protein